MKNVKVIDYEVSDEEMEKHFKNAKAVILPYESATQSGVIVDAYKYSKPVIAFNVGAITEQVNDGKTGYLVTPGNLEEFKEKIEKINKMSKEEITKMQQQSYQFGYKLYSAQENSKNFIQRFLK